MNNLRQFWNSLPHKAAFAVVFVAWCALFQLIGSSAADSVNNTSMFNWLYDYYNSPTATGGDTGDSLCPWIPVLALVLLSLKREEIAAVAKEPWAPALGLVAVGLLLHLCGFVVQQARLSILGYIVGSYGLMGIIWGRAWLRVVAFPWFILVFAIPVDAYTDQLTLHLRLLTTKASVAICQSPLLGLKLVRLGTQVYHAPSATSGGFRFDIAAACSGIRSASVILLITLVFAHLNFRSFWRGALIVLAAVPLALLGNTFRLVVVFMCGDAFGQEVAKMIETNFGFVTYAGALLGVFFLGWLLREKTPPASGTASRQVGQSLPA